MKSAEFRNFLVLIRWCVGRTIFKTGFISKRIDSTFKNKKNVRTYYGIRRNESKSRRSYSREDDSPKISKQKVSSPIIDWIDYDIWLYILSSGIDFNDAYRKGYTHVGCIVRPQMIQFQCMKIPSVSGYSEICRS